MPWWTFIFYSLLAALLWTCFWALGLFYLDENFAVLHHAFSHIRPWVGLATVFSFAPLIFYLLRRQKKEPGSATQ
jgi:membrane protein DedA with SNARE-associated domain